MLWLTKAAVPHLPAGSTIIDATSVQAYSPSETPVDYASTKAVINNFTKSGPAAGAQGHPRQPPWRSGRS